MEQHVNEWRNNSWDELMDKLATEHLVKIYSLDEMNFIRPLLAV